MKKVIRIPLVLIILLVLIVIICIKVNAATTGIVTEITVNVRKEASIDSDIIMFVTQDDEVEILEKTGDWYKIKYNNTEGYVYDDFIKVDEEVAIQSNENTNLETENEEITKTIEPKLQIAKNTGVKITPTITSNIIYTTSKDEKVELLEQINDWSYIQLTNIKGWVRNSQLQEVTDTIEEENEKNETQIAYIKYDNVNLRKEPSTDASIIEKLSLNTEVTILESVDSIWNQVKVGENIGYISKELLASGKQQVDNNTANNNETTSRSGDTTTRENTSSNSNTQTTTNEEKEDTSSTKITGEDIVAYAKKYLGYDYVYGGSSPKTGFDCSGFTSYVYEHFGYSLSRTSIGQASNGTKVSKDNLKPGDLVIYKNTSLTRIGHVGIYIGNNQMIHASEPGVGVTITDIDSKAHNYPKRFVMGRRIIYYK